MNILLEKREDLTTLVKVTVGESDYAEAVEKALRDFKRKANIPGFRPGMVPMGLVNKMYRKGTVAEEAYRSASQACFDYIEKEKIVCVGDVIPSQEQEELDFEGAKEHEFIFEIGVAPEVKMEFGEKDKQIKYSIKIDKKLYDNYEANFLRRFGKLEDTPKVESEEALGVTLDNKEINIADAYVGLVSMDEKQRKPFMGKKVGDVMDVDITELYPSLSQRAAILQLKEEELESVQPKFKLTITRIRKLVNPTMDDDFFKMAFPDGAVKDEKAFKEFINKQIESDLVKESEFLFGYQMRAMLIKKADLKMPEAFLRRWLFTINEGKYTMEQIDQDFPQFLEMMQWSLVQKHFADKFEIDITPEEALEEAKMIAVQQFAQYGMAHVQEDMLANYAGQMLADKNEARKIYDKLLEKRVVDAVEPSVKVDTKSVSVEEFNKVAEATMAASN